MERYVITFSKTGIRNGWVEVQANSEAIARRWANHEYGVAWSSIYGEDYWFAEDKNPTNLELFPLGCIGSEVLHYESAEHMR